MALTRLDHTGDGIRTVYDLTFALGYLQESDIYVSLDTDDFTTQLSYSFLNSTQIVLDTPVDSGVAFNIRRVVDRSQPINDYEEGAILRENNLDDSFAQSLMILQEIEDGYMTTAPPWVVQQLQMAGDLDMAGFSINSAVLTSVISGVNATASAHFMPALKITEKIDARMQSAPEFDPNNFQDYGLVTSAVADTFDYGSI